jgi:DNA-binding GntR family transcriptional regulator
LDTTAQKAASSGDAERDEPKDAGSGGAFAEPEKSLSAQAYERVLDMIMSGQAKPGAFFTERRLAEQLAMSRTPLRDALLILESEGLVVRLGPRGVQVATMQIEEFVENLGVRRLLEPEAARIAAGRIEPDVLAGLKRRFEVLRDGSDAGEAADRGEVRSADDRLHSVIADAAGNARLAGIVRTLRRQTLMFDLRSLPERFGDTCREHLAIVAALSAGDGEAAAQAMRDHLDAVRASIVARLARL